MLCKRNIRTLAGLAEYQNVFCFPIVDYYKKIGFDFEKESFESLAKEYMALYHGPGGDRCPLHTNAKGVLKEFSDSHISQIILSASEKQNLLSQTSGYDIVPYFDELLGISDIYAESKVAIGIEYINRTPIDKALLIGDTTHDFEVSQALGADCVLIARGHQSKNTLSSCGVRVLDDIGDILEYVF